MLDRDELAARCLVALLHDATTGGTPADRAGYAVRCADALLSALVPVAPASGAPAPLPGAPLAAPSRPEWVRITSLNAGGKSFLTVGKVYRVTGFGHRGCPQVNNDQGDGMWCLSSRGLSPDPESPTFASWEPCAAPSPAATPAEWVPSVGDVVKHVSESDAVATTGQIRVVVSTNPIRWVYVENGVRGGERGPTGWGNDVRFVRPATSSERAAAGLPPVDVEESRSGDDRPASGQSATKPVDRAPIDALIEAVRWVLNDAAFKAPEQVGEVAERWVARLERAMDSLPPSLTKRGAS